MRKDRVGTAPNDSSQVQEVDVDLAGAVAERRRPSNPRFDALDRVEQILRRTRPADLHGGVPETPLFPEPDRLGAVERGDVADARQPGELGDRPLDLETPVADVGAEAEVRDPRSGVSTLRPRTPRT